MIVKEITNIEFDKFAKTHVLSNFYQTSAYGKSMEKLGYKTMYIGVYEDDILKSASLILVKNISLNIKYGYAPRGFLTDYFDFSKLKDFTEALKTFFKRKGFAFIKLNPLITYSLIDYINNRKTYNENSRILIDELEKMGYKKLKDNVYFESILPKYNAIVDLKNFNFTKLDSKLQNRLNKLTNKGLNLIKGDIYNISSLYELIKRKDNIPEEFYKSLYKNFDEFKMIDLYLLEVNYHDYLKNLQEEIISETTLNEKINKAFQLNSTNKALYNEKMRSDKLLNELNEEITKLNNRIQQGILKETVGAAIVIKQNNVVSIYASGFKKEYNKLLPNHFMHYMLFTKYKSENYSFMDLNGITGDFSKDNPYKGLNEFKLSWKPKAYEYIGEFDLIINQTVYSLLWSTKKLQKEFDKPNLKEVRK